MISILTLVIIWLTGILCIEIYFHYKARKGWQKALDAWKASNDETDKFITNNNNEWKKLILKTKNDIFNTQEQWFSSMKFPTVTKEFILHCLRIQRKVITSESSDYCELMEIVKNECRKAGYTEEQLKSFGPDLSKLN